MAQRALHGHALGGEGGIRRDVRREVLSRKRDRGLVLAGAADADERRHPRERFESMPVVPGAFRQGAVEPHHGGPLGVERRDGGQQRDAAHVDGEAVKGGNRAANGGEDERLHRDGAVEKEPAGVKVTPAGSSYGAGDERRQRVRGMRVTRRASSVRPWAPHSPGTRSRPA